MDKVKITVDEMVFCPLLGKEISDGYCYDLRNIGTDDILFQEDKGKVPNWDQALKICIKCGRYEE